jgi:4-amino-4-deoxy-L-arabinose transferase-like glycosyltransferase
MIAENINERVRRDPIVWTTVAIVALVFFSTASRYDAFRNELYFIACGRHPAFGYADLPPLVPIIAAATQLFGVNVWLLRLPSILALLALIPITADFARVLGGDHVSAWMAALGVALAPLLLGVASTLGTPSFEPLGWTLCSYLIARALMRGETNLLIWAGVVAGITMETKYGIAGWMIGLGLGIVLTSARRIIFTRELWIGIALAVVIAAPSLIWQQLHGWPFRETIRYATEYRNFTGTPIRFEIKQIFAMNLALAPLWITGIIAPFVSRRLRDARFLAIAFVVAIALIIRSHGKDYYAAPAYPTMFAVGAVASAEIPRWLRTLWYAIAVALLVPLLPVVFPILSPPALQHYLNTHHLRPSPNEREAVGAPLTQIFSDELGWRPLEHQIADIYRALPADEQARAAIIAMDYGEAAAIDVYGRADGLPPALCGQLQYWFWGTHGYDGSVIIGVNGDPEMWARMCDKSEVVATFGGPYTLPFENGPIVLCHGLRRPLPEMWHRFRRMH